MESDFYSQFKKSKIAKAVILEESFTFKWRKFEKIIFFWLSVLSFLSYFLFQNQKFFGLFLIFLFFYLFAFLKDSFFENYLKNPKKEEKIFDLLDFRLAKAIFNSLKFLKQEKINSSIFLYFLLDEKDQKINFIFSRLYLPLKDLKRKLREDRREEDEVADLIFKLSKEEKEKISLGKILYTLAKENKIFKDFLFEHELRPEYVLEVYNWIDYLEKEFLEENKFWKWRNLMKHGTLGRGWSAGYTVLLDKFSFDLTEVMKKENFKPIFAHEEEVRVLERILASPEKNDALIIGEPGSGRRSIIEFLARNCALGESLPELNFKRVVYLDLPKIISETETTEEAEKILDEIFSEAAFAENVILVIDNLHQYIEVETERKVGIIEISGILSSYLPSPKISLIGITTFEGLYKNLEQRPTLLGMFEKVEVKEVSKEDTLKILEDRALRLEKRYKVFFTLPAIKSIIDLCERYIFSTPFPEKAIEVIDELAIFGSQRKKKIILKNDVEEVIERRSKIPIGEIEEAERKKLLNLEDLIHQKIIDQEEAVREISEALKRARTEIRLRRGPMGCFLFLGPTGVGKTETAKALAEIYFGSEKNMIRLDMSEFQNLVDISRLLGGAGREGILTAPVREKPFSLILLDEFEKAHPNILNLFLQVFDEGHLTDGMGKKVYFKNTIIIATSNAGYQIILEALKEKDEWSKVKEKLLEFIFKEGIFKPELINRFDAVVVFKPLTKENLLEIAELLLRKIKKQLAEKDVDFIITPQLKEKIVEISYDITFGARNMQRVIQEKIGNSLAQAILEGRLKRGSRIEIDPQNFQLTIKL